MEGVVDPQAEASADGKTTAAVVEPYVRVTQVFDDGGYHITLGNLFEDCGEAVAGFTHPLISRRTTLTARFVGQPILLNHPNWGTLIFMVLILGDERCQDGSLGTTQSGSWDRHRG